MADVQRGNISVGCVEQREERRREMREREGRMRQDAGEEERVERRMRGEIREGEASTYID